jgi:parallel beta-helix repeat protein
VTIQANTVYDNAYYSPFGSSGITLGFSQDVDSNAGTKNFVTGNTVYGNQQLVPTASAGTITDGEGIIVDDNSNDQTNGKQYVGGTLVENNLTYQNGGPGIESYDSSNASILYNTAYENGSSGINPFEIFVNAAGNTTVENNIMYARPGGQTGGNVGSSGTLWDYNLLYGGASGITGPHDKVGNPLFVNAGSDNFEISSGSPAIGAANANFPAAVDLAGNPRPGGQIDIGAYQYIPPPTTPTPTPVPTPTVSPNGTMITTSTAKPIIDASGDSWTLVSSSGHGLQIAVNGTIDASTANVVLLEVLSGRFEQENAAGNWYTEPGPSGPWTLIAAPSIAVTGSAMGRTTTINGATSGTTVARGDTFVLTAPGVASVTAGLIANSLTFSGFSSVSLTGGRAAETIVADGGVNTFSGGYGNINVTGGVGADSYIYHVGDGLMTINDFSSAKGDTLTFDKSLQSALIERSDGHGGEIFGVGKSGQGIDLVGLTSVAMSQLHFA